MHGTLDRPGPWVGFGEWTQGRSVQALGTNAGATELPFQGWRRFKEAFAPELVHQAVQETEGALSRPVATVLDPFGGSGTTALAAQFLGVKPTTIEVNPFLADLIEAKVANYDFDRAGSMFGEVMEKVASCGRRSSPFPGAPETFVEPGVDGRFVFSRSVADRLADYRDAIDQLDDPAIQRLFRVILASAAIPVSNVVVSGKGRRYRRGSANKQGDPAAVDRLFADGVLSALYDLRRYEARRCRDYTLLRGDARELLPNFDALDLAVFSPPYPNSFDYTDVYNVELWILGYLKDAATNRALREATLRSHVQISRDFSAASSTSHALNEAVGRLKDLRTTLWNPNIPEMIQAYFHDMCTVLRGTKVTLNPGGRVYIAVGDSRYAGVDIPVAKILADEAPGLGYQVIRSEPFRSMRASPQQGGRAELAETLLVLGT